MKKVLVIVFIWLTILTGWLAYHSFYQTNDDNLTPTTSIPACNLLGHFYYSHYDRDEDKVHQVEKGFDYYGTIHEYVKSLERNQINELTTNALYYMNRDVYVNKDDDSYIYVRMDKDNYSLLYYDDATENKVLKIIQANQ
ncbi:MAG: hypothetical protein UFX20_12965 [Longibaculum muris]|uniref:Uncharacterized protein n=1 Tax=Longibaculum muris TaxID=1796628 RepID=A0A4R3YYX9_9FIRM|nr:hypothetical protein [Longibaculum muris]KXU52466.1 hypothetical protein HMPREF3037_00042 [Candidatus Stoquefichus sp. KLE1796]MBS5370865.1 hypothetical protein [Coprobacillus cateniformis]MCR1888610.1 hypothetical protein [Longibaculum muris]MED9813001.1 hypothetical protein [Longibaculum muris]TCV98465.1 hypothetical protein EDD60_11359 [Longibaculum muris]